MSSASSVTGGKPAERRLGRQPREHAGRRVGERIAAGIVDRHVPARERRQHAAGQRAVGRDQRRGLVRRLHRLAQRDRDGQRLLLGVGGLDHGDVLRARVGLRGEIVRRSGAPARARSRPPAAALRTRALAAMRRRLRRAACTASRTTPMPPQQRLHGELRMAVRRPRRPSSPPISVPGRVVEIGVEAGQHHRAVRQLRDGREQLRGRRHRAGRAGGDHRRLWLSRAASPPPRSAGRGARPARSCRARRGCAGHGSRAIFRNSSVSCQ